VTWTYSEEYYKRYTRDTWNESAAGYAPVQRNLDLANPALLEAAAPRPGERALDVATGLGEPALSLAARVAPGGSVLGVDLSERMVELARAAAKSQGLDHVRFEVMDAEELALPDSSFDLAVCRFGLQIVTNPDKAIAELRRVVRPGGRVAATVWGAGERSPAIHAIIGPMLKHAEPDETGYLPTPYEMGGEGELAGILEAAGFHGAWERRLTMTQAYPDEESYLRAMLEGTPIGHSLHEESEDVQREVVASTRKNLAPFRRPDGSLALPAEYVVLSARRP
jgi:ubiquinone/menaquinone biosynthesis C-methylase UbiE